MATPNRYPMRNSFLTSIWVFHVFSKPICLTFTSWRSLGGFSSQWTPFLDKSNFQQPTGEGTRWTACFELGGASRFAYLHSGMVKGTKNCNGPNPHGKGNLSNKKTFKKCTPDTMFSQSTTIHYATLLSSALPCFFPYSACGCNRHQRPRVRAGRAREEPHPVGFQGIHLGWESLPQTSEYQKAWQSES